MKPTAKRGKANLAANKTGLESGLGIPQQGNAGEQPMNSVKPRQKSVKVENSVEKLLTEFIQTHKQEQNQAQQTIKTLSGQVEKLALVISKNQQQVQQLLEEQGKHLNDANELRISAIRKGVEEALFSLSQDVQKVLGVAQAQEEAVGALQGDMASLRGEILKDTNLQVETKLEAFHARVSGLLNAHKGLIGEVAYDLSTSMVKLREDLDLDVLKNTIQQLHSSADDLGNRVVKADKFFGDLENKLQANYGELEQRSEDVNHLMVNLDKSAQRMTGTLKPVMEKIADIPDQVETHLKQGMVEVVKKAVTAANQAATELLENEVKPQVTVILEQVSNEQQNLLKQRNAIAQDVLNSSKFFKATQDATEKFTGFVEEHTNVMVKAIEMASTPMVVEHTTTPDNLDGEQVQIPEVLEQPQESQPQEAPQPQVSKSVEADTARNPLDARFKF